MIPTNFTISDAWLVVKPLALFILGMVIYAIFIFKFYRFLARKDIFELDLKQYNTKGAAGFQKFIDGILYVIKYLLIFPILTFFWFLFLSIMLVFLSKTNSVENILLVGMALVGSVRVTSYYNEDLSKDLAKMLPFALLGIFIIDISFFSFSNSIDVIFDMFNYTSTIFYYFVFIVALEFILRIINGIKNRIKKR